MRSIDRNRGSENSSPIENIRNTTPNSAEVTRLFGVRGPVRASAADQDADGEIGKQRRQRQQAECNDPEHHGGEQHEGDFKA